MHTKLRLKKSKIKREIGRPRRKSEEDTETDLEGKREGENRIHLKEERNQWRILDNTITILWAP
jgi:hypothetical protein